MDDKIIYLIALNLSPVIFRRRCTDDLGFSELIGPLCVTDSDLMGEEIVCGFECAALYKSGWFS